MWLLWYDLMLLFLLVLVMMLMWMMIVKDCGDLVFWIVFWFVNDVFVGVFDVYDFVIECGEIDDVDVIFVCDLMMLVWLFYFKWLFVEVEVVGLLKFEGNCVFVEWFVIFFMLLVKVVVE